MNRITRRRPLRSRTLRTGAALAAAALTLGLAACSSTGGDDADTGAGSDAPADETTSSEPVKIGVVGASQDY